ncbi:hypothetical protein BJ742DRAFT_833400 [Cladochytrium replicatum]|nr:hypothetical protein BJ742DRAFT_833400 [Cladochytrium replicatum]
MLQYRAEGGTGIANAIQTAHDVMLRNWDGCRCPVLIFLSDGEDRLPSTQLSILGRSSTTKGIATHFHANLIGRLSSHVVRNMADPMKQ